jgi:hypothetical protein
MYLPGSRAVKALSVVVHAPKALVHCLFFEHNLVLLSALLSLYTSATQRAGCLTSACVAPFPASNRSWQNS